MKRFSVILPGVFSALLLLTSCSSNLDKLDGKWSADAVESMKLSGKTLNGGAEQSMAEKIFSSITMKVDAKAKKMTVGFGEMKQEAAFTVLSDSGKTIFLENQNKKITIEFVNDDLVTMRNDKDAKAVAFKRVK